MIKILKEVGLYIWQLPQNLLGLILSLLYPGYIIHNINGITVRINPKFYGGISLGKYIFLSRENKIDIKHEIGHTKQSKLLGPLYLVIIGIPSIIHALVHGSWCHEDSYYDFWTEKWADKLMNIKRY